MAIKDHRIIEGILFTEIGSTTGVKDMDSSRYQDKYSESSFWDKIIAVAKKAGLEVIGKALQLYYALQRPETPIWAKTVIIGALGYFISPIDAIPDVIPVLGYTDDLGVIATALITVSTYITEDVKADAKAKTNEWFGE